MSDFLSDYDTPEIQALLAKYEAGTLTPAEDKRLLEIGKQWAREITEEENRRAYNYGMSEIYPPGR